MKKFAFTLAMTVLFSACAAWAGDAGRQLSETKGKAGALAVFRCTIQDEFGSRSGEGQAVCIATSPKAIFITMALDSRMPPDSYTSFTLTPAASPDKAIKAELLGVDPEINIGFIAATEPYDKWSVAAFAPKANLNPGQLVTSIGLMGSDTGYSPYAGMGYVSAVFRMPQQIVYVTGGKLTSPGSPVFNEDGKAIGLVSFQQRAMNYQLIVSGRSNPVALREQEETNFFTPVDEFAHVLTNIPASPAQVRRLPWMGVLSFNGVSREVAEIKKIKGAGVTVEQVLPDQPAANAGLKDGDIILAVNGENIEALANPDMTAAALLAKIRRMPANQKVKFTIRRGEETKDVEVTLAPTPTLPDEAKRYLSPNLGFIVREKVMLDRYLDKSSTSSVPGLPVLLVGATTAAATAGMQQGDLIVNVNGQQVTTVAAMKKIIDDSLAADSKKPINVVVRRGDQSQNLTIKPIMSAASQP